MFRTIKITYSEFDFNMLEELSKSPLAAYVKILHYDASELFDPGMSHMREMKTVYYAYIHSHPELGLFYLLRIYSTGVCKRLYRLLLESQRQQLRL